MLVFTISPLFAVISIINAAVINPLARDVAQAPNSAPTCECTTTVTEYRAAHMQRRQETCPPPSTVTVTIAPALATIYNQDPSSIASSFSYASAVDSIEVVNQSQDRPTGVAPDTASHLFTHTALGPAVIGTDTSPDDGTTIYSLIGATVVPVATTIIAFPPWGPADDQSPSIVDPASTGTSTTVDYASLDDDHDGTITSTVYRSTVFVPASPTVTPSSNLSMTDRGMHKRQDVGATCTMIFAYISDGWASWCNNWDGVTKVSLPTTFATTVLMTNVPGGRPVPESVYNPQGAASSQFAQTSKSASISGSGSATSASSSGSPTSTPAATSAEANATSASQASPVATSIVVTATIVTTVAVTTVTTTSDDIVTSSSSETQSAPSSCGETSNFLVTFDDLPTFSTNNTHETHTPFIFDPYEHFEFSIGYGYGPPPSTQYASHDGDSLAVYNPASVLDIDVAGKQGRDLPGSFGAGSRAWNNTYWFNATSAYVGCNYTASIYPCDIVVESYRWIASDELRADKTSGEEMLIERHPYPQPPCISPPCQLTPIFFDSSKFSGLSTINFRAFVGGVEAGFYLDSFAGTWTNNSCEAARQRSTSRK